MWLDFAHFLPPSEKLCNRPHLTQPIFQLSQSFAMSRVERAEDRQQLADSAVLSPFGCPPDTSDYPEHGPYSQRVVDPYQTITWPGDNTCEFVC